MNERIPSLDLSGVIALFPELVGVGGVQEAGRLTAAVLSDIASSRGWSFELLSLNDPAGAQTVQVAGRQIAFRGFGRAKLRFVLSALGCARNGAKGRTWVAIAAHPNLAQPAAWMQWVSPSLRTVVMAHGVDVWRPLPFSRRRALLRANLVLAPSSDTAQKLADVQGVAAERIRRLPWPLNPDFLSLAAAPESLRLPEGFPRQGRVILTVGRWAASERYKGADDLIRALQQLRASVPDLHLVAVGNGDDLPRLQGLAAELGVSDRAHFLTDLTREQIAACNARADVFALPSKGEGFGLVFLEAMAFAKPVVGAACGGITDVVEHGVNGLLVPPGDTGRLAQELGLLLQDGARRAELGRQGAQIVRQKYQIGAFRAGLEQALDDCSREPVTVGVAQQTF